MTQRKMAMEYDSELGRWVTEGVDEWYSLRSGESIRLHIGSKKLEGRLALGNGWSIVIGNTAIGLIEEYQYTVTIEVP